MTREFATVSFACQCLARTRILGSTVLSRNATIQLHSFRSVVYNRNEMHVVTGLDASDPVNRHCFMCMRWLVVLSCAPVRCFERQGPLCRRAALAKAHCVGSLRLPCAPSTVRFNERCVCVSTSVSARCVVGAFRPLGVYGALLWWRAAFAFQRLRSNCCNDSECVRKTVCAAIYRA